MAHLVVAERHRQGGIEVLVLEERTGGGQREDVAHVTGLVTI